MSKSAGLQRAYAVLRRLELLREQDILDPLPSDTDTEASSSVIAVNNNNNNNNNSNNNNTHDAWNYRPQPSVTSSSLLLSRRQEEEEREREKEEHQYGVIGVGDIGRRGSSQEAVESASLGITPSSLHDVPMHERNKVLQRMLQDIVELRKKAGKMKEDGYNDVDRFQRQQQQREEEQMDKVEEMHRTVEGTSYGRIRRPLTHSSSSYLLSPLRDDESYDGNNNNKNNNNNNRNTNDDDDDNVFFDDPMISPGDLTYGAKNKKHNKNRKNMNLSPHSTKSKQQDNVSTPQKSQNSSQKKSIHTVNSPVVSDYAKSLIQQHRSRKEKLMHEIAERKERSPITNINNTDLLQHREGTPPSAALSPITHLDDTEEGFSPFPNQRIDFDEMCGEYNNQPLMSYLQELTTMGSEDLQEELQSMKNCDDDGNKKNKNNINTSSGSNGNNIINKNNNNNNNNNNSLNSELCCREWFALTALVNSPDAIRHIIVPLFLSELTQHGSINEFDSSDNNSRVSHILCALIGLGELASASLPTLLEMLMTQRGVSKLVALAIRAVGGDDGLHALCRIARSKNNSHIRSAAIYGISTLANPVLGSTSVYCISTVGLRNNVVFYQPPVNSGYIEISSQSGEPLREMSLQRPPPYRPTDVFLHAETVRQQLLQFTASRLFRRCTHPYTVLPFVLHDFTNAAMEAAQQQDMPQTILITLRHYASELENLSASLSPRVLPFSYDPHYINREDELFAVEETLMTILLDSHTPPRVVEQTLVSLASLPDFATTHVAQPLLDFVIHCVSRFEQRCVDVNNSEEGDHNNNNNNNNNNSNNNKSKTKDTIEKAGEKGKEKEEEVEEGFAADVAILVAGLVALGRIVRSEGTSPIVTDTSCEVLMHNLVALPVRVRHAACIGLGEIGAVSNKTELIAQAVNDCLNDKAMNHETVAWALARLGQQGISLLLDRIDNGYHSQNSNMIGVPLPMSTRLVCVRALAMVDLKVVSLGVIGMARQIREKLIQRLCLIIAENNMEENVLLECVYAIAEILGNHNSTSNSNDIASGNTDSDAMVNFSGKHYDEAAVYYRNEVPNEAFEVLKSLLESSNFPFSVEQALFYSLCAYGGAHGELYTSQTAIQSPIVLSRAAATFGLRACGGKVIRTLAVALNDDAAEVRLEAFDTLTAIGVDAVLTVLRTRPHQHTRQVIAALRDCLLRDIGRNAKREVAQELYIAMTQSRTL